MEVDPQNFFRELNECSKDNKNGYNDCERLLYSLNRSLIEDQFDKSDLGTTLLTHF